MSISHTANKLSRSVRAGTVALFGIFAFGLDAAAATKTEVMRMISEEAARNGRVPAALALAVAKVESNFNDQAVSSAGARGVMQIMPSTAMGEFGVPKEQLMDPRLNVRLGIAYLERLYNQYGQNWELALSHYNGGSLRSAGGRFVTHDYTRQYVADVVRWSQSYMNDDTAVALADGRSSGSAPTQVASRSSNLDGRQRQREPNWREVRRTTVAMADGDRVLSDMLAQSTRELRERFRASLNGESEVRWERYTAQPAHPIEARREEWPAEGALVQPQAPVHTGRFNYAPFGSGRFL